jgi:hypothetical protein
LICPFTCGGDPEWLAASASGQMSQAGIKNKYGFDMQVSAADMAVRPSSDRDVAD